jgi:hypothetical protein
VIIHKSDDKITEFHEQILAEEKLVITQKYYLSRMLPTLKMSKPEICEYLKITGEEYDQLQTISQVELEFLMDDIRRFEAHSVAEYLMKAQQNPQGDLKAQVRNLIVRKETDGLSEIRDFIARHMPYSSSIFDHNFLKYYQCCCCGSFDAPADGFELEKVDGLLFPICDSCRELQMPVDYKRVAEIYQNYAVNTEYAFFKIKGLK